MRWLVILVVASRAEAWSVDDRDSIVQPSRVTARLDRTTAVFEAHYSFAVTGPQVFGGTAEFTVPPAGVAVAATVVAGGASHRARFVPAHDAEAAFEELMTLAGGADRRGSVVLHANTHVITADTASPHDGRVDLDIRYEVPTCLFRDVRYAAVPRKWPGLLEPTVPVDDVEAACGFDGDVVDHTWVPFATRDLAGATRIGMLADALETGAERIARVEIDLAGRLADVPADLATAIVIDASRSMTEAQLAAQLAVVESYLRHAPASRVQLIASARTPRPLLPGWMVTSHAFARVDRELRGLDLRNGSNLDAALASAATWLARVPGTHRILVFTDELVPKRIHAGDLARLVRGATVHAIALDDATTGIVRDDAAMFAPLAKATRGLPARAGMSEIGELDAEMLVRPISLDGLTIDAPGYHPIERGDPRACGDTLGEGVACTWLGTGFGPITVSGWLWGQPIRRVLRPDPTRGRTLARELTTAGGLDPEVQGRVDRLALAVNDQWSLVATWGGSQGYADVLSMGRGYGSGASCCRDHHTPVPRLTIGRAQPPPVDDLRPQLAPAMTACRATDHRVEVALELTLAEIVGVEIAVTPAAGDSPATLRAMHHCIEEAVWDIPLAVSHPRDHIVQRAVLGP